MPGRSSFFGLTTVLTVVYLIFFTFFIDIFKIQSPSMAPNLEPGTFVLVKKWGYGSYGMAGISLFNRRPSKTIKRADVLAFRYPKNKEVIYMKRVIGLAGDTVEHQGLTISVNDMSVEHLKIKKYDSFIELWRESLDRTDYEVLLPKNYNTTVKKIVVPKDSLFVLGDNRGRSSDSRSWGFLPLNNVIGKLVWTYTPGA